ncbi:MAG: TatD family hydrolase [Myxococcaceae bacterium]|nr:TatD family hydrolase [Myxococcaceae bacterium]
MIDTHCHLDVPRFDEDRSAVLERAWAAGVEAVIVPAIGPDAWEPLLGWPRRDKRVQVGLGIHPQLVPSLPEADDAKHLERLDALLARDEAIAVGECGLDAASGQIERQVRILKAHFALARKHGKPLLMHVLRAHPQFRDVIADEPMPEAGLLMHSYSGSADLTPRYVKYGCHFSFAGPVTFVDARRPLDALRSVPLDRLMVETDAPDQAPHPHRGSRSEPAYVPLIVEAMERVRGEPVRDAVTTNARRFFRLE